MLGPSASLPSCAIRPFQQLPRFGGAPFWSAARPARGRNGPGIMTSHIKDKESVGTGTIAFVDSKMPRRAEMCKAT